MQSINADCWKTKNSVVECKASENVCENCHYPKFVSLQIFFSVLHDRCFALLEFLK